MNLHVTKHRPARYRVVPIHTAGGEMYWAVEDWIIMRLASRPYADRADAEALCRRRNRLAQWGGR